MQRRWDVSHGKRSATAGLPREMPRHFRSISMTLQLKLKGPWKGATRSRTKAWRRRTKTISRTLLRPCRQGITTNPKRTITMSRRLRHPRRRRAPFHRNRPRPAHQRRRHLPRVPPRRRPESQLRRAVRPLPLRGFPNPAPQPRGRSLPRRLRPLVPPLRQRRPVPTGLKRRRRQLRELSPNRTLPARHS